MTRFRLILTVLPYTFLFLSALNLFSQGMEFEDFPESMDVSGLEYYLDAADRQNFREQWLDYSRFGLHSVMASWEKELLLLAEDDFELSSARVKAEEKLNDVIRKRFASWLNRKLFENADRQSLGRLSSRIEDLNRSYLYEKLPDGTLEYKTTADYEAEKQLWNEGAEAEIAEMIDSWKLRMSTAFSDLRASVNDEELVEDLEESYAGRFETCRKNYSSQLYRLYNMEQSRFIRMRLYDHNSLQYRSGQKTALEISAGLAEATRAELDGRLDALVGGLNSQVDSPTENSGIVRADDWQVSFNELLERGLNSWDSAEQELLMQRIEWERDAGHEIADAEQVWADAFAGLRRERSEWMLGFRETLEEGNMRWTSESRELEAAVTKALSELDDSILNSKASLKNRMDNLIGMLLQSVNMMRTARSGWEYWMDRFDGGAVNSFSAADIGFDSETMRAVMAETRPDLTDGQRNRDSAWNEAVYWVQMFETYEEYSAGSQRSLADTYGVVIFDNPSLHTAFTGDELSEGLTDEDLLLNQEAWEALYLDEYQVELLKAGAYQQYWRKQQEIARAVYDYAADNSSTKENAEATSANLTAAKAAYDSILNEYADYLDRLSVTGKELEKLQSNLQTVQNEIDGYQQQLTEARKKYSSAITDLEADNPQYLAETYREYYLEFLNLAGIGTDSETDPSERLEEYLLAAAEYGYEKDISLVSAKVVKLIAGEDTDGLDHRQFIADKASLSELRSRMLKTGSAGFYNGEEGVSPGFYNLAAGGENTFFNYLTDILLLDTADYRFDRLIELFSRFPDQDYSGQAETIWEMQRITDEVKRKSRLDYELRIANLRIITADNFSSWSERYFGGSSPDDILRLEGEFGTADIVSAVSCDIEIFNEIIELYNDYSGEDFIIYDWQAAGQDGFVEMDRSPALQLIWDYHRDRAVSDRDGVKSIESMINSLESLSDWLESTGSLDGRISEIENAILNPDKSKGQNYLKDYLNGRHQLRSASGDMFLYLYADEVGEKNFLRSLSGMFREMYTEVPSLAEYNYEKNRTAAIENLMELNLIDQETLEFVNPAEVWDCYGFTEITEISGMFNRLDCELSGLNLPDQLSDILSSYISKLKDYTALRGASVFGSEFSDNAGLDIEIRRQSEIISSLNTVKNTLQGGSDQVLKLYAAAVSDGLSDELRSESERRFIETAGFDLASAALCNDGFSGSQQEWDELLKDYISPVKTGLSSEPGIDEYSALIVNRAQQLYSLGLALEEPETADKDNLPKDFTRFYRSMLWNSLDFRTAEELIISGADNLSVEELEKLKIISDLMPESEEGFPADPELEWLYKGNIVLKEIDDLILTRKPEQWASDSFSAEEAVRTRYFSNSRISSVLSRLRVDADEALSGVTVLQKASALWNDEFRAGAASGLLEGIFEAFTGLCLIHDSITVSDGYPSGTDFTNFLSKLTDDLHLSSEDKELLSAAASNRTAAVEERLTVNAGSYDDSISGEAQYWYLVWHLRADASEEGYTEASARSEYIFNDYEAASVIKDWISGVDNDFDSFSREISRRIDAQLPLLTSYAEKTAGSVYGDIIAYSVSALLVEKYGFDTSETADFVNWFLNMRALNNKVSSESVADYVSVSGNNRLYKILNNNPDAAVHQLKKDIISGLGSKIIESRFEEIDGISDLTKNELLLTLKLRDDLYVYNKQIHGDFEDFLNNRYDDQQLKRRQREQYMRYMGSPASQWDDPVFISSHPGGTSADVILEEIAFNRTRGSDSNGIKPQCGLSTNDIFISEILMDINEQLYGDDNTLISELELLRSRKDVQQRGRLYLNSLLTEDRDNWRSFLNADHLSSNADDNLIPSETIGRDEEDYKRDLTVNPTADIINSNEPAEPCANLFRETGNDQDNIILDAANDYLDNASRLAAALNDWKKINYILPDSLELLNESLETDISNEFWDNLETSGYPDIKARYYYNVDEKLEKNFLEKRAAFFNIVSQMNVLKTAMGSTGNRRERLIRMSSLGNDEQVMELKPLSSEINMLENKIEEAQAEWQRMIDGDAGYRELENKYSEEYKLAQNTAKQLEDLKHNYSVARAVFDYASAGYLSIDYEPDTSSESDSENDESGNVLSAMINMVSPSERLAYINEKLLRATAAYDAMEHIINDNRENRTVYKQDEVYRAHFDAYLSTFRESLVLNKINLILNKSIAEQEIKTRNLLEDLNKSMCDIFVQPDCQDNEGNFSVPDGLEECYLKENENGGFDISWGEKRNSSEKAADGLQFEKYFQKKFRNRVGVKCV